MNERPVISLEQFATDHMLRLEKCPTLHEAIRIKGKALRCELGWDNSPALTKVTIAGVVVSYLKWMLTEKLYLNVITSPTFATHSAKFWAKQALDSQRMFFRSCESLARIKRLSYSCPELDYDFTDKTDKKSLLM